METGQLLQLQQLLEQEEQRKKKSEAKVENQKLNQVPPFLLEFKSLNSFIYSQFLSQISHTSIPYELNIDPIWYLLNGPIIVFPYRMISQLSLEDLVEYFKKFPHFHWSKYPTLYKAIVDEISKEQEHSFTSATLSSILQQFTQFRNSMEQGIQYIYDRLYYENTQQNNKSQVWKWIQYLLLFYFVSKFISKIYKS